ADMLGVVVQLEMPLDEDGDAGGGPQLVGPAVALGSLLEQFGEAGQVVVGEARLADAGDGGESLGLGSEAPPAVDGVDMDAEDGGDRAGPLAFAQSLRR